MNRPVVLFALAVVVCGLGATHRLNAQFNGVQVNVNQFGNDVIGDAANEPSIAVDPNNPDRMAIGWRQFDTISSNFRQAGVAYTTDGGQTWTADTLDPGQFRSDPVLDFDADGNFYYSSLTRVGGGFQVDVLKSTDGGANWSTPVFAYGGDKQWMAVDRTSGIGRGNIYQHWNVQFSINPGTDFTRSTNGGSSFETSITGPMPFIKWGQLEVGPSGTLYFAGSELDSFDGHLFSKSTNAQDPMQTPTFSTSQVVDLGGTTRFGVSSGPNPGGLLGQVSLSTDHSPTETNGSLYILGSVNPPGPDPLDVNFIRSTDDGNTWSAPIRVNNDPTGTNAYQWFGTMSVAPNGRIDVVYNETPDAPNAVTQLFYAYSMDAGDNWVGNTALSTSFDQSVGYPNQDKLGDYYDMISDENGAYLAYAATYNGGQDVYFLRILQCDFDASGMCDIADMNDLLAEGPIADGVSVTPGDNDRFDLNGDGLLNLDDRDLWLAQAGDANGFSSPYKLGDTDLDGSVTETDFDTWNSNKFTSSLAWNSGNFNGDSFVDGQDFNHWNENKFTSSAGAMVPEPAGVVSVILLGLLAIGHRRRT